ncbi:phenylacetic acid degradation operon negative regulatory protein [Streptomyces sp. SAI-135]|jgi:phenylacetic acid degradation operon negative regulatory protein|uniref:PaaX family transcriptional regulator n=1 Tax=unclassified Streptomyces TaxID=2593676 RepID=UPI00247652A1|nr:MULTISPECIES: PaaX family transcriptional regulator C-terminal domain-containing protein [unclassified Streptomyces]MDH6523039.1 phenylacetic acid degradation operon negative regulatory protein [Streptomyces sp. SAI-090]MDH6573922.1 phenylacetic acid degradation operon negative regulatory protein [Streptomyces sp. SAI-117]MDH6581341.1 phenylacetic acid degradation operon negative regulatory protein [Streptomyces sp. SAI-133]MDH6613348.1 phenylacetic acid degradation operon negative regulator
MSLEKPSLEALVLRRAEEGSVLPRQQTGASPQRLLTTLLGEYWLDSPAALPMSGLIALLAEFGISETSARATANRLVKRGVLAAEKSGRQSYLRLSDSGREDSRQKNASIVRFGSEAQDWDGLWTVAAFSVPEQERHVRHRVRSYLRWLGFAPLFDGLWVSAHADPGSLTPILRAAGVENLTVLRASEAGGASPLRAWDLDDVAASYRQFISDQRETLAQMKAGALPPSAALVHRTKVFDAWRVFPGLDPNLPEKLLPADWPRAQACELFAALFDGLAPLAALRFRQIIEAHDSELAELTAYRTTATWAAC